MENIFILQKFICIQGFGNNDLYFCFVISDPVFENVF